VKKKGKENPYWGFDTKN